MTSTQLKICFHDIVRLRNGQEGLIRFIGPTSFAVGTWYGIELLNDHRGNGSNNGTVENRQYFECEEKNGMFVEKKKIEIVLEMSSFFSSDDDVEDEKKQEEVISPPIMLNTSRGRWTVGDEVNIEGKGNGVIEFVGHTLFGDSPMTTVWFGIALALPTGTHRGRVEDVMYFATKWNHAVFVKLDKLRPYDESANLPSYLSPRSSLSPRSGYTISGVSSPKVGSTFSPRGMRPRSQTLSSAKRRRAKTPKAKSVPPDSGDGGWPVASAAGRGRGRGKHSSGRKHGKKNGRGKRSQSVHSHRRQRSKSVDRVVLEAMVAQEFDQEQRDEFIFPLAPPS